MKLLVTRPQPGADATVARIAAAGHSAIHMPLFALRPIAWNALDSVLHDALLLTSGNAVRLAGAGMEQFLHLPAYAVGDATARAAQAAGLTLAGTGSHDAAALLPMALEAGHDRLLWLVGRDRIGLPAVGGLRVDAVTVYESDALPAPPDFATLLRDTDAVLLHSPRAATHFAWLCDSGGMERGRIRLAAFAQSIADAAGDGWREIHVSPAPNDAALLSLLAGGRTG